MGGMNGNWLQQLAPDHAPPAVGWWPLAPGWWVLAAVLLVAVGAALRFWFRPARRLRRLALRELRRLELRTAGNDAELARGLELLLRRYALTRYGRDAVARLHGEAWIEFVAGRGGAALAGESGASLLRAAYGGEVQGDSRRWLAGARDFLRAAA